MSKKFNRITNVAYCDGYEDVSINTEYTVGDAVCQLADYENLGYTPTELKELLQKHNLV